MCVLLNRIGYKPWPVWCSAWLYQTVSFLHGVLATVPDFQLHSLSAAQAHCMLLTLVHHLSTGILLQTTAETDHQLLGCWQHHTMTCC